MFRSCVGLTELCGSNYRVERSRLTHFKFDYCASTIACRGYREEKW